MRTPETKNENTRKKGTCKLRDTVVVIEHQKNQKRSQYLRTPLYCTMSNLHYQSCDKQNHDRRNCNWKLYIVESYCRKYLDDPGDQTINDDDVVRSENYLWANHEESQTWRKAKDRKSNTHSIPYGLCCNYYTSGPNNMGYLDGCGTGEYKTVQYGDYTFDSQTIAEKLGKHHTTVMAGQKQKWLRTTCNRFNIQMIHRRIEDKHKHIEDAAERKETIKKEKMKTSWKTTNALYSDTRYSITTGVCWREPGTMNVPGVHKSELIKKTFQS
jgi:hypothetical protein